uniref:Scol-GGT n=1 Tax=Hemiscolopendra marginata TaxID=943146 RepID=A0A646QER6_9MYRI
MTFSFVLLLMVSLAFENGYTRKIEKRGEEELPSKMGVYEQRAVASDAVPCAAAGDIMLEKGGSAVDAAIATLLCIGVYNPQSSGIGGGFFMVIYNRKTKQPEVIDAREEAPAAASENMFFGQKILSAEGGLSIAVPGELRGMALAHKRHGKLPWEELFAPAINLSRNGFPVGSELAMTMVEQECQIKKSPSLREIFFNETTKSVLKEGDILKRTQLADTLEKISKSSADEFYLGETGKKFLEDVKKFGGILTAEDLKKYQPILKNATVAKLSGGLTFYSVPPPGSGYILSFILRVLDKFHFTKDSVADTKNAILTYHRFLEALKYGYGYRTKLGDERFVDLAEIISELTSEEVISQTKEKIEDDKTHEPKHYGAEVATEDHGTAHLSVIGPNGDAVAVTSTINYWFGAGLRSPHTGIILNNEMDDFSAPKIQNTYNVPPSKANFIRPGKRPQSSTCPSIFVNEKGDVVMAIGASGGTRITSSVSLTTMRILWMGRNIKEAIDEPRLHHQLIPNEIEVEPRFPKDVLAGLKNIGHKTKSSGPFGSLVVGIKRTEDGKLTANYDYRRGGSVAGLK